MNQENKNYNIFLALIKTYNRFNLIEISCRSGWLPAPVLLPTTLAANTAFHYQKK